jgi:hypothetical protein
MIRILQNYFEQKRQFFGENVKNRDIGPRSSKTVCFSPAVRVYVRVGGEGVTFRSLGSILQNSISAETFSDKFSSSSFRQMHPKTAYIRI